MFRKNVQLVRLRGLVDGRRDDDDLRAAIRRDGGEGEADVDRRNNVGDDTLLSGRPGERDGVTREREARSELRRGTDACAMMSEPEM